MEPGVSGFLKVSFCSFQESVLQALSFSGIRTGADAVNSWPHPAGLHYFLSHQPDLEFPVHVASLSSWKTNGPRGNSQATTNGD